MSEQVACHITTDGNTLYCHGDWTAMGLNNIQSRLDQLDSQIAWQIDASQITKLDSAGAWVINQCLERFAQSTALVHFSQQQQQLIDLVKEQESAVLKPKVPPKSPGWLYYIGMEAHEKWRQIDGFLILIGELAIRFYSTIVRPKQAQLAGIVSTIDKTGFCALPILALLSFMVGVILAYQLGIQLKEYGANIYIVNLSGTAILREFGPLIAAIVVSGRTGSAFTAQIGLMKVNEEIDALRTMGISPVERLVLTRILGLIIAFPLLIFWADLFGMLGSMVMAKNTLDVHYYDFLMRFHQQMSLSDYLIGVSKAPVFAVLIATVGCYQGLQVTATAESVGTLTTRSVVQSIFLIILADAAFSVLYSWANI